MKKKLVKVVACATMLAMVLSFSGCGKSGKYKSIKEYTQSEEVQDALDTIRNTMTDGSMTIDVRAEGNKMVYSYKYSEIEKAEGMEEALKQGIEKESATFQETADAIKEEVKIDEAYLVIEYLDKNGTVICSEEFKAK